VLSRGPVKKLGHRRNAIKHARSTRDGSFASLLLDGRLRYVVFSGARPVHVYPPLEGDLVVLLANYNGQGRHRPDDLKSARARRWVKERVSSVGGSASRSPTTDSTGNVPVPVDAVERFAEMADQLPELLQRLTSARALPLPEHEAVPASPGIYLFSEGPAPMYVGQTRNLKQRIVQHGAVSSRENQASFAFRLAEEAVRQHGLVVPGTRKERAENDEFKKMFRAARDRVAAMNVQWLQLADPVERTILEVFVAQALNLDRYNDFETH
jgi:hypothetical protein